MTTRVRLAGYQGEQSVHTRALRTLAQHLDPASFEIHVTDDVTREGRRAADLLTLTESGEIDICYFSSSYLSHLVPELRLLDLPFLFRTRAAAHEALDGPLGRTIGEKLEAAGEYRILGWWDNGFRHLTSAARPIRTPEDCRGQKLRTMGGAPQHAGLFTAMGFEPVPLDVRDLVPAIESGRVDAQENPLTNIYHFGIHRYHRWISLTGHLFGASLLLCGRRFYEGLTAADQEMLVDAADTATVVQRGSAAKEDTVIRERLAAANAEILELTEAELEAFRGAVAGVRDATLAELPAAANLLVA